MITRKPITSIDDLISYYELRTEKHNNPEYDSLNKVTGYEAINKFELTISSEILSDVVTATIRNMNGENPRRIEISKDIYSQRDAYIVLALLIDSKELLQYDKSNYSCSVDDSRILNTEQHFIRNKMAGLLREAKKRNMIIRVYVSFKRVSASKKLGS